MNIHDNARLEHRLSSPEMKMGAGLGMPSGGQNAPSVTFDFTTGVLSSLITFSRSSPGTRVNAAGLIETVGPDVPRFDHDPVTHEPLGLLIEGARTNLLLNSSGLDDTVSWQRSNVSTTAGAAIAPDGTLSATKVEATPGGFSLINQSVPSAGSATGNTFSIFLKKGSGPTDCNTFVLRNQTTGSNLKVVTVDYATGTILQGVAVMKPVGNGWYRLSISASNGISNGDTLTVYTGFTGNSEVSGEFAYIWGAQLEAGLLASTYIPTAGSQVARAGDVANISGPAFAGWWSNAAGSIFASYSGVGDIFLVASLTDGTALNQHQLLGGDAISAYAVAASGSVVCEIGTGKAKGSAAAAYSDNNFGVSTNGGSAATDMNGVAPLRINRVRIGARYDGATPINGHIRVLRFYRSRLSDARLRDMTSM